MSIILWLKWWFWDTQRCQHQPGPWTIRDAGMGKARHCTKCGKCLDIV